MAKFVKAPDGQAFGTQYISHVSNPYVWFKTYACDVTLFAYGDRTIVHRVILNDSRVDAETLREVFVNKLTSSV